MDINPSYKHKLLLSSVKSTPHCIIYIFLPFLLCSSINLSCSLQKHSDRTIEFGDPVLANSPACFISHILLWHRTSINASWLQFDMLFKAYRTKRVLIGFSLRIGSSKTLHPTVRKYLNCTVTIVSILYFPPHSSMSWTSNGCAVTVKAGSYFSPWVCPINSGLGTFLLGLTRIYLHSVRHCFLKLSFDR